MTTEAFGRLASWSSFNIVVGRHDEFAHSRVAIPQKRGTTAKSIVLHFPHPTHSNWKPRKDAIPATPVTAITRGAVGRHAKIGKTRVASHTHWRKSTPNAPPITMFGRPRWSGPGRRFRYDFPALSSMIRGCCRRERGRPMTADRNQAGYTDASGAHGAGLVVMWVRRGRPDSSEPAATGKPS